MNVNLISVKAHMTYACPACINREKVEKKALPKRKREITEKTRCVINALRGATGSIIKRRLYLRANRSFFCGSEKNRSDSLTLGREPREFDE